MIKDTLLNLGRVCVEHPVKTSLGVAVTSVAIGTVIGTCYYHINKKKRVEDPIDHKEFLEKIVESFDK